MRIALCLSNHLGVIYDGCEMCKHTNDKVKKLIKNLNNNGFTKYYLNHQADPKICFNSIKKHVLDCNDNEIDIFIHSWDYNLKDKIIKLYNPKKYIFEKNNEINLNFDSSFNHNFISKCYSLSKSIELKKQYEIENDFIYDYVMWSRIDNFYFKDIIIDSNIDKRYIYQEYCSSQKINGKHVSAPKYFLDGLAISSSKNIDSFGNIINSNKKNYFKNHTGILDYFTDNNIEIRNLNLFNIYHVNRVYVIYQFLEFNNISKEDFLKRYDLLSIGEPHKKLVSLNQCLKNNPEYTLQNIKNIIEYQNNKN